MKETEDVCEVCEQEYFFNENDKVCVERKNTNCKTNEEKEDKCKSCESTHFFMVENGTCVDPTSVENCETYNAAENKCATCKENMFLDAEQNKCLNNPDGIPGCQDYSARNTCQTCKDGMYLKDNKCAMSQSKVDNCAKYASEGVCMTCLETFLMVQDKCEKTNNTTCASWKDVDNCQSCAKDKVLKKVGEQEECVSLGIDNCEEGQMDGENIICTKCKEKMLPEADGLSCVVPTDAIIGCQNYDQTSSKDAPKCEQCEIKRILSVSRDKCNSSSHISDGTCSRGKELADIKCMYCQAGNVFDRVENKCVPCGGKGCLECDLVDLEKCFLCKSGYSMKVFGECEAPPVFPKFASKLEMLCFGVLVILSFFKFD